jgi:hypothetical protein
VVQRDPQKRSHYGIAALWKLFNSSSHSALRTEMDSNQGRLNLHFGWFCRRVAEELDEVEPSALALVNFSTDDKGQQTLTLKPAVVAALKSVKGAVK